LWKVSDEPTGILMEHFYNNLKSMAIVDKAEALRQAQLELMKDPRFAHPNYWGAFALYGDWR
ncbi:MAG TPA: CHAT domain-containing protein, partial [Chitinophagaceae bacterium]|nr:CHAT domain-containing protein [Chitinophagaceae bacterium]